MLRTIDWAWALVIDLCSCLLAWDGMVKWGRHDDGLRSVTSAGGGRGQGGVVGFGRVVLLA